MEKREGASEGKRGASEDQRGASEGKRGASEGGEKGIKMYKKWKYGKSDKT